MEYLSNRSYACFLLNRFLFVPTRDARTTRCQKKVKTPFERVLERKDVASEIKNELKKIYEKLNPTELRKRILQFQDKLFKLATAVRGIKFYMRQ
jgi:polyribonucleotide nucleotidyltransferase